jgi:PAS domain S-box-containing protein
MFEYHRCICNSLIQHSSNINKTQKSDGTILFQNHSIEHLFGYRPSELTGQSSFRIIYSRDLKEITDASMQTLQAQFSIAYRAKQKIAYCV